MKRYPQHKIYPYSGSQNSTVHPVLLDAKDVTFSDNIIYTLSSTKKIRPGLSSYFDNQKPSGSSPILKGKEFNFWDSTNNRITTRFVYFQNGEVKAINPENQIIQTIASGLSDAYPVVIEVFFGLLILFIGDGQTIPLKWNGIGLMSNLYSDGSTYTPRRGRKFMNRLWIDDPEIPGRIYGSKTNDPTDFTDSDAKTIDLNVNDGDPDGITAFMPPKDKVMYIGKRHSLFSLTPQYVGSNLEFVPNEISTDADIGCISHNGCVSAGGNVFFPSERGYHKLISSDVIIGIDTQFTSAKIQNDWTNEVGSFNSQFINACYSPKHNSIFILYPQSQDQYANSLFGYSLTTNDWYSWYNFNQVDVARITNFNTKKRETVFMSFEGDIGLLDDDVTTDYGQKYTMKIKSGTIVPTRFPDSKYSFKYVDFIFKPSSSGSFTFYFRVNGRLIDSYEIPITSPEGTSVLGEEFLLALSNLGGVNNTQIYTQKLKGDGIFYDFLITFTPDSDSERLEIIGLNVDAEPIQRQLQNTGG